MKNICELTAHEIREMYDKKEITVPEVVKAFLDKITVTKKRLYLNE